MVSFAVASRPVQAGSAASRESTPPGSALEDFGLKILDRYQNPLFVIDERAALVFKNRAAAHVLDARLGFRENNGRLRLGAKADAELQRIMAGCRLPGATNNECYGLRLAATSPRDWLWLVRPLEHTGGNESGTRRFMLQAVGRTRPRAAAARILQELFGLTARETSVVAELLGSGTLESIARRLALSRETIRSHLKRTFRKCNVHSKAELLLLLQSAAAFETDAT